MQNKSFFIILELFFVTLNVPLVFAETSAISLEEVLLEALSKSPAVSSIDANFQQGISEAFSTELWKNPELSSSVNIPVSYQGEKGDSEVEVSISQPVRLSFFGLRSALSELLSKVSHAEQQRELLEFTQKVHLSYVRLWGLNEKKAFLEEAENRAHKVREKLGSAGSPGVFSLGEKQLFVAATAKLGAERRGVEAEIKRGLAELLSLSSVSLQGRRLQRPDFSETSFDEVKKIAEKGALPIQERMKLLRDVAQHQAQIAKVDAFPELTPQILYRHSDDEKEFFGVGISFALPIHDSNQAEKMKRNAMLKAAETQQRFFFGSSFNEQLNLRISSYKATLEQAEVFEKEVVPALKNAVENFEALLDAGQGGVLQVWQTQDELTDSQSKALELWVKASSERSELAILLGRQI